MRSSDSNSRFVSPRPPNGRPDWKSAGAFMVLDENWRGKIWKAGLVLLIPVVGWPVLLGYRWVVIRRLLSNAKPVLPEWEGNLGHFFAEGLKAVLVINVYYAPIYTWMLFRLRHAPQASEIPAVPLAIAFLVFPITSTLIIPSTVAASQFLTSEAVILLVRGSYSRDRDVAAYFHHSSWLLAGVAHRSNTFCI